MAKYDILGDIVSPEALKQLQEIEKLATSIGSKLKGVTLSGLSGEADAALVQKLNAETAVLIKQEEKLQQTIAKGNTVKQAKIKLTQEEAVTQSALNNVSKLRAVLVSQETSALQKLDAQIRLNVLDAQKYVAAGDTQNANYLKLIANTKQLSMEYDRMAKASGSNMVKTQSMYGATFQLTQVMRELPNFAIDARIGFMALSNNLPMLIDSFKQLSQQIDVNTGKAYGNMGALKQFGKSLLSLNTVMIIASTLLVLFGDDIVEFGAKLFASDKIINKASESIKALIAVTRDYSGSAASSISSIQKLGIEINKYGSSADYADTIVKEFNDTFNTHLTSIDQVKAAYPEMAKAAIDAAVKTQAAMSLIQRSSTALLQKMEADQKLSGYKKSTIAKQENMVNKLFEIADKEGLDENEITTRLTDGKSPFDTFLGQNVFKKEENRDIAEWFENPNNLWFAKYIAQQRKANKVMELLNKEAAKLIQPPKVKPDPDSTDDKTPRDKGADMNQLFQKVFKDWYNGAENIDASKMKMPAMEDIFNIDAAAIDKVMKYSIEQYENGLITFQEFEDAKNVLMQQAADKGVFITEENKTKIAQIIAEKDQIMKDAAIDTLQSMVDNMAAIWGAYFDYLNEKLEEQADKQAKIEDEKYKDIEDREKAGVITKQQSEEEKARTQEYYNSVQEELDKKQKENDKKSFLIEQAAALAQVWINFAMATSSLENLILGGTLTPLYATIAGTSSALILAQSLPYFKDGTESSPEGLAVLGDGYKHELGITPDGKFFLSPNTPTLTYLEKGTQILPDVNKVDLMSVLAARQVIPYNDGDKRTEALLKSIDRSIRNQKQGNFYGMPLIKQLDNRVRFDSRRKSLMN